MCNFINKNSSSIIQSLLSFEIVLRCLAKILFQLFNALHQDVEEESASEGGIVTMHTSNKQSVIRLRAVPLPPDVTTFLENNHELLRTLDKHASRGSDLADQVERLALAELTVCFLVSTLLTSCIMCVFCYQKLCLFFVKQNEEKFAHVSSNYYNI